MSARQLVVGAGILAVGVLVGFAYHTAASSEDAGRYLFVWAADADSSDSDFLAVIDADPASPSYGEVAATLPVGAVGTQPHHIENRMAESGILFVNGFRTGTTFIIDLNEPTNPVLRATIGAKGPFTYPHSFERLPNGNVLAAFQNQGEGNEQTGGLVELDEQGEMVRARSAEDPDVDPDIRPYSVTVVPELDRVVSTSTDMRGEYLSRAVQVWRLSDLSLIKTIVLPNGERGSEGEFPAEPRVLSDGRTVMVNTFSCGLYLIHGLEGDDPEAELVHSFPFTGDYECSLAAVVDDYWIQTVPASQGLICLNISDPTNPVEVDELTLGEQDWPHYMTVQPGGRRIAITGYGALRGRVLLANLDPTTGKMSLDERFRGPGSQEVGVSFTREEWPHGRTGDAIPHGVVFSR